MLEASRRADVAERQLQRRESEAGHLTQKQAYTEQALLDLHEQHAQAAAAAAARQLVMHVSAHARTVPFNALKHLRVCLSRSCPA